MPIDHRYHSYVLNTHFLNQPLSEVSSDRYDGITNLSESKNCYPHLVPICIQKTGMLNATWSCVPSF